MRHFHSLEEVELKNAWATIGAFDGVHRGHQAILAPLIKEAHAAGCPAVVVTFFPHPAVVLRGARSAHYLTTPDERAALLGQVGIDAVVTLAFNPEMAALSAQQFMQLMKYHLGLRQLWVGYDFALGRNRQGDIPTLRRLGEELGYSVRVIAEVTQGGGAVSSSQVRALLREGNVGQAARLLGRPYHISGEVVHGDARGRKLGIPTANLAPWTGKIVPANGVYATWAWVPPTPSSADGREVAAGNTPAAGGSWEETAGRAHIPASSQRVAAVTSIGVNPTFENQPDSPRIEAHLLNFDRDLYGQNVTLEFLEYLRPELRFPSVEALLAQIVNDIDRAKEIFAQAV